MRLDSRVPYVATVFYNRFPDIRSIRNPYIPPKNRQRNNNRKIVIQRRLSPSQLDTTAQRVLSARQHKIDDQNNIIQDLKKQIDLLRTENKTLKSQSFKQEKALQKIENRQSDLPQILDHHEAEVMSLREQLRKNKELLINEQKSRKESELEIVRLRSSLSKAQSLVNEKGLAERSVLQAQLTEAIDKLESTEASLKTMTRHVENMEKSHKREIITLKKQLKILAQNNEDMNLEMKNLKFNLKEKEKLLEIQNIYSHRIKVPHRILGSAGDQNCAMCVGKETKEQDLQKLDFSGYTNKDNQVDQTETNQINYLDPDKIKSDIRQILEEEIKSGRIKPVQTIIEEPIKNANVQSFTIEYEAKIEPEINEESQRTLVEDVTSASQELITDQVITKEPSIHLTNNHDDLDSIDQNIKSQIANKSNENISSIFNNNSNDNNNKELKFSYPCNENVVDDSNLNDIETISAPMDSKRQSKNYKFDDVIENLHNGKPSHNKINSIEQKNNNSIDESGLPPLSEEERKQKEQNLMSELFGNSYSPQPIVHGRPYPNGSIKKRVSGLPWNDNDEKVSIGSANSRKVSNNKNVTQSIDSFRSESIEEIVL